MFERFTEDARRGVTYAQEESRRLNHQHIGTEHLLLGLLHDDTPTGALLEAFGVNLIDTQAHIEQSQGRGKKEPRGHVPFTARAQRTLQESLRQSLRLGQRYIGQPHLLRGLLEVSDCVGVRTLVDLGVDLELLTARAEALACADVPQHTAGTSMEAITTVRPMAGRRPRQLKYRPGPDDSGDADVTFAGLTVEELAIQHGALVNALRRYARHDDGCEPEQCSCGMRQVLDDLDPPTSG